MANNQVAYGFTGLEHLFSQRIAGNIIPEVWTAIQESTREYVRQVNGLMAAMVTTTTDYKRRYHLPGSATLQPLDDLGNPLPVREAGFYDIAFPLQGAGTAFGDNRVSRAYMTVLEANNRVLFAQRQDADWMKRHIIAALMDDTGWVYPDREFGDLNIVGLANNDAILYPHVGQGMPATDQHYHGQAAAISDAANPFVQLKRDLDEHPSARGPYVAYIPTNLRAAVENLAVFVEPSDSAIRQGVNQDTLVGTIDLGFGDELVGYVKGAGLWIIEWKAMPDDYIIAVDRNTDAPVIAMRQHVPAELQGIILEGWSSDGNLRETRLIRYAGFGVQNRVGAAVTRIGNATYAPPTMYDAPLAV